MNTSAALGSLPEPSSVHGAGHAWPPYQRGTSALVAVPGAVDTVATPRALAIDYQRRLRARGVTSAENYSSFSSRGRESLYSSAISRGSSLYVDHSSRRDSVITSPQSELQAVRALLQSAQRELDRLAMMESRTRRTQADSRQQLDLSGRERGGSLVSADASPPPSQSPPMMIMHNPHRSRLERLAQGCDCTPSSPSASSSTVSSRPLSRARAPSVEGSRAHDERSASYFSAVSRSTSSSPSPASPSLPHSPLACAKEGTKTPIALPPSTQHVPDSASGKVPVPRVTSSTQFTMMPTKSSSVPFSDDALDRYERFYRQRHRLQHAHKRRAAAKATATSPRRHPGPHPSVHTLRCLTSPHAPAPLSDSPHRTDAGREGSTRHHSLSPRTRGDGHTEGDTTLLEQVEQWPQRLRRFSTDSSFTASEADVDHLDTPPLRAHGTRAREGVHQALPLYDPLEAADVLTDASGAHLERADPHAVEHVNINAAEEDDDTAYLMRLRARMASQRAEWLRVHQQERLSLTPLLRTPRDEAK